MALGLASGLGSLLALVACARGPSPESITPLTATELTPEVREDFEVFALRCSKCHSLARPLSAHVDEDEFWVRYVAKMRRQPGSGISEKDGVVILRFLHVLVENERAKNAEKSK